MTAIQASHRKSAQLRPNPLMWLLYLADAGLLVTSGLIHLHLWDIAYQHVKRSTCCSCSRRHYAC